ncbi:MAG TPA: hypothetical protein VFL57_16735, partial [Bryobacteraceae bacterium]|nr:hypothetical protein [Bryobacteraceae bacterium]
MEQGRRRFILGGVAAVVAEATAGAEDREIRTAFIGVGIRGTSLVGQVLEQPNTRVVAICDTDANARDRAQGLARRDSPRSF